MAGYSASKEHRGTIFVEDAKILSQEKRLVADLCAYRNILCLHEAAH